MNGPLQLFLSVQVAEEETEARLAFGDRRIDNPRALYTGQVQLLVDPHRFVRVVQKNRENGDPGAAPHIQVGGLEEVLKVL